MRFLAAALCVVALAAFLVDATGLNPGVTTGMQLGRDNRVAQVPPRSPADRAGFRAGDLVRFDRMPLLERIALDRPIVGRPILVVIQRGTQLTTVSLVAVPVAFWDTPTALVWLLALLYAAMALLVAWRAPPGRQRGVIIAILVSLSFAWSIQKIALAVPSIAVHFAGRLLTDACIVVFLTDCVSVRALVPTEIVACAAVAVAHRTSGFDLFGTRVLCPQP